MNIKDYITLSRTRNIITNEQTVEIEIVSENVLMYRGALLLENFAKLLTGQGNVPLIRNNFSTPEAVYKDAGVVYTTSLKPPKKEDANDEGLVLAWSSEVGSWHVEMWEYVATHSHDYTYWTDTLKSLKVPE